SGFLRQAETAARASTERASTRVPRVMSMSFPWGRVWEWGRSSACAQRRRPGAEACPGRGVRQLANGVRFHVEDPELPGPATVRGEDQVSRVGRPRGLLVRPLAGMPLDDAVAQPDGHYLHATRQLRLERDQPAVGRPIRVR